MNPVRKELEAIIGMGYHGYRVFEDWVGLMFYAFQRDDPPYLEIMGGYRNTAPAGQREADHFANAAAYLMDYMRATNEEALGPLYEEYAANHYTGQYFTPSTVARLMARITHTAPPETGRFKVLDPACGAGACLIAAAKEQTFEQNGRAIFVGQDIDLNCARMTALNLMFFNLDGSVGQSPCPGSTRGMGNAPEPGLGWKHPLRGQGKGAGMAGRPLYRAGNAARAGKGTRRACQN